MTEPDSETRRVFLRLQKVFGDGKSRSADSRKRSSRVPGSSVPYGAGRDPHGIGDVLGALTARLGWDTVLAKSELLNSWPEIVGAETAEHSHPLSVEDGVMSVACDSTAWATQLRLMRSHILNQIVATYPDAGITSIRFEGPGAPSWKRGPKSVPGRGPRDTYG